MNLNEWLSGRFETDGLGSDEDSRCRLRWRKRLDRSAVVTASYVDIDKSSPAVVLAEIAAGVFIAGRAVANRFDGIQTDEGGLFSVLPKPACFNSGPNGARFTAVFVNNDLRLFAGRPKAG